MEIYNDRKNGGQKKTPKKDEEMDIDDDELEF